MGLLSSAAGRYQSDKEPNFLKIFGEERSGQASRVRRLVDITLGLNMSSFLNHKYTEFKLQKRLYV